MSLYLYCMAYPMEALVVSMLTPEAFASYMAIGSKRMSRGKEIFLELKPDFKLDYFDLDAARKKCVPEANGQPKATVYVSLYRVLEHVPLDAIVNIHLVTKDGQCLAIAPQRIPSNVEHPRRDGVFLYQELAPVRPLVVSRLDPLDFGRTMTNPASTLHLPRLLFARMKLGDDPAQVARDTSLPYSNLPHVQDCVHEVIGQNKGMKTVERGHSDEFFYSAIIDGLYLAEPGAELYFPFPKENELKDRYYYWWRSAD